MELGVDRHRFPYYRAKRAAEQVVESSGAPWTVLRATQFHDLIDQILGARWFLRTPHMRFQPVAPAEVARRLADLAGSPPSALSPDFGGPEIVDLRDLAASRRAVLTFATHHDLPSRFVEFRAPDEVEAEAAHSDLEAEVAKAEQALARVREVVQPLRQEVGTWQ